MRIILSNKQTFKSKAGQEYVKCSYIDPVTGESGELFSSREQFDSFNVEADRVMTAEQVKNIDWPVEAVNAEFNQKGRLIGLK